MKRPYLTQAVYSAIIGTNSRQVLLLTLASRVSYNKPMSTPILATKLYMPPPRPRLVLRPRLVEQLNAGLHRKLTLISAPAGFGKTTLVSEWVAHCEQTVAWLSLDEGDSDPTRFLTYFIAALQTIAPQIGESALSVLQSAPTPPTESVITLLLNDIATMADDFILVLDDYHVVDAQSIDAALAFLLDYLPPQLHLVMATREDPALPLARLRARGQLTELRVMDLRFSATEAAGFLNEAMGLNLAEEDVLALESRTEGWIAGLQLAALSLQGHPDAPSFIKSFTGSHHFILDYLVEEVLQQQSVEIQNFLLNTSILDRLCGGLCEAVLPAMATSGQAMLHLLEQANLFIVPLDNERQWYRYHRLFADLLRQRLQQSVSVFADDDQPSVAELHSRASLWYEANGYEIEAFQHATAAQDVARATRLIEGNGMPLHFREGVRPVLNWLDSLPPTVLDEWPVLWTNYASVLLVTGQVTPAEQALQSAEAALADVELDDEIRDTIGRIAAIRSTIAATLKQVDVIITESQRALEYLHPANHAFRTATLWKLGYAYHLQGKRREARQAYSEVITTGEASGNKIFMAMAIIGLASLQHADNQLHEAAQTYQRVLEILGEHPLPIASEVHLGLAKIAYEWNDLEAAQHYVHQSIQIAQLIENSGRVIPPEIILARLKLIEGDIAGASAILTAAHQSVQTHQFAFELPEVVAAQIRLLLRQGAVETAADLLQNHNLPLSTARIFLAQGDTSAALDVLATYRQQMEAREWVDELLKTIVLQAMTLYMADEPADALQVLGEALTIAQPSGFVRLFVDEGDVMAELLADAQTQGMWSDYVAQLLDVFAQELGAKTSYALSNQPLIEPLSERELEVLHLIADGLSNNEISERLFLALSTVKGHNRRIFDKLQVQRRTEAVARARELGLL